MKEVFYEESAKVQNQKSAKTKYYVVKAFSIASYVMMAIWLLIFFYFFNLQSNVLGYVIAIVPLVVFFFSGFFLGRFKNNFYLDYDYTFVSGSIRVSKIIKNVKRKFIIEFDVRNIEKLGKYGSETYISYEHKPGVKKKIFTLNLIPEEGKEFYYLVVNVDEDKQLFVFECTETFMATILKFSNKLILEKDFK